MLCENDIFQHILLAVCKKSSHKPTVLAMFLRTFKNVRNIFYCWTLLLWWHCFQYFLRANFIQIMWTVTMCIPFSYYWSKHYKAFKVICKPNEKFFRKFYAIVFFIVRVVLVVRTSENETFSELFVNMKTHHVKMVKISYGTLFRRFMRYFRRAKLN